MKRVPVHSMPANAVLAAFLVAWALLWLGIIPARPGPVEVDNAVVFVVDTSTSLTTPELQVVRGGHAIAIASREVVSAILQGPRRQSAFAYVEFADTAVTVVGWTLIDSQQAADDFAARIVQEKNRPKPAGSNTGIGAGLAVAYDLLQQLPFKADERTVDVAGDGRNNTGVNVETPRALILATGATINGIPVTLAPDSTDIVDYYRENIIGGARAFIVEVRAIADMPLAIRRKILLELY